MTIELRLNGQYTGLAMSQDPTVHSVFTNDTYIVAKHLTDHGIVFAWRLTITRRDNAPIRTWRELQDIKNAVVGSDAVALEVYPAEDEVTDSANMSHLWVLLPGLDVAASIVPRRD